VAVCAAAYAVYFGLPLILEAIAETYQYSNAQLGWIGAAESGGLLLGAVAVSALGRSLNYRTLIGLGIAIAVVSDIVTLRAPSIAWFCSIRVLGGFGNGLCYSGAVASLSRTSNATRNFSILAAISVVANSFELWLVPRVVGAWGVHGIYVSVALLFVVPTLLLGWMPKEHEEFSNTADDAQASGVAGRMMGQLPKSALRNLGWMCLLAIVLFNLAASEFYTFAGRIGTSLGLADQSVSNILTICNLISGSGSIIAYALSRRWGQHRSELAMLSIMVMVFLVWSIYLSRVTFALGTLIFFEVWTIVIVFQLGTLSNIDSTGRRVALVPAAQGVGQSFGPYLAGSLLAMKMTFSNLLLSGAALAVSSLVAYAIVYGRLRTYSHSIAEL
jgi:predicted MFS family arabinose efflux permease